MLSHAECLLEGLVAFQHLLVFLCTHKKQIFKQTPAKKMSLEIHDDHAEVTEIQNPNLGILKRSDSLIPSIDISGYSVSFEQLQLQL